MQSGLRERIRDHRERLRRGMCREVGSVAGKEWTETGTPEGTTNAEWVCVYLAVPTRYGARQGLLVVPKVVLFFFLIPTTGGGTPYSLAILHHLAGLFSKVDGGIREKSRLSVTHLFTRFPLMVSVTRQDASRTPVYC